MDTLADRFRHWYEHERDGNRKLLAMLESVPEEQRTSSEFRRAVDLMAHLVTCRKMWLHLLGAAEENPGGWWRNGMPPGELPAYVASAEEAWVAWLRGLDDAMLAREFTCQAPDGHHYRWKVEAALTQVSGHAWYHRGQIAQIVKALGGKPVSTDYIFWNPPTRLDPAPGAGQSG